MRKRERTYNNETGAETYERVCGRKQLGSREYEQTATCVERRGEYKRKSGICRSKSGSAETHIKPASSKAHSIKLQHWRREKSVVDVKPKTLSTGLLGNSVDRESKIVVLV